MYSRLRHLIFAFCLFPGLAFAQAAQFDLVGPTLEARVTHGGVTLPISEVPNLSAGDRVWIKADLPPGQSAHYLLVTAFLRGVTDPPPQNWFTRSETWTAKGAGGLSVTVPQDARQVLVFLAPQTGGDFKTLVDAVRGRPGAFVRASQDLNQASLDRSRLDAYLVAIHKTDMADPNVLKTVSPLLARSLAIKFNQDCLQKLPDFQAACLMQGQDALVLNDGHSTSMAEELTSGDAANLVQQLSTTPQARSGYYSPYLGALMDMAHMMSSFHTAQYQYIPSLTSAKDEKLSLLLNTPPSFHDPLSVLVVALPAVQAPQPPPLQPVDPKAAYCLPQPDLVLPVVGAPLVFSTRYAHDMVLRRKDKSGQTLDIALAANPEKGGFTLAGPIPADMASDGPGEDVIHGLWGFSPFDGPAFRFESPHQGPWRIAADDQQALVVGRDDNVRLEGASAACIESVMLKKPSGEPEKIAWTAASADQVMLTIPLANTSPGVATLLIKQFGAKETESVDLQTFAQEGHLASFELHAGDPSGLLKGARLDEVRDLTVLGVKFDPAQLTSTRGADELTMTTTDASAAGKLVAGAAAQAKVTLKDGRSAKLDVTVLSASPTAGLIGKSVQPPAPAPPIVIQLTDPDELAQGSILTFSLHAQPPTTFSGDEKIEVATTDGAQSVVLTAANGLTREDAQVLLATLDTGKAFNASAFGPLRYRIIANGSDGEWRPLATLVRLPILKSLKCAGAPVRECHLKGSGLFLIDAIANDAQFTHAAAVPIGFPGDDLVVPHPSAGQIYLKLHDDPAVVNTARAPAASSPRR